MRLNHVHLHVRSVERARAFYEGYFEMFEHAVHGGDILFLRDTADGMDLALAPSEKVEPFPDWFHIGFRLPDAEAVRALHDRMQRGGASVTTALESHDDFVFFRCADPDGTDIEVYWEASG